MFPSLTKLHFALLILAFAGASSAGAQTHLFEGSGKPNRGAALILEKGCGACHNIPGISNADGVVGPPLDHMGRRVFVAGMLHNTPENLAAWILDPQRIVPGNAMPSVGLSALEAMDVAAYLETLR